MSTYFEGSWGLIRLHTIVTGPLGEVEVLFLLDTGSDSCSISEATAALIGCEKSGDSVDMVTAGGTVRVPITRVTTFSAGNAFASTSMAIVLL